MDRIFDFGKKDSWPNDIQNLLMLHKGLNHSSEDKYKVINAIKQFVVERFTHIVYYHGSATDDISSYLIKGILPSNIQNRIEYARRLLPNNEYPTLTDELFNQMKHEYLKDRDYISLNEGKIYFVLDVDILSEDGSTHYLCYGGEHLMNFVSLLGDKYKEVLRSKLKPVIFKCKVPVAYLDKDKAIDTLAEDIIEYFQNSAMCQCNSAPYINSKIEPDCILEYEFLEDIKCS